MKNKGIVIFLIVLSVIIITVVALDFNASKPDKLPENPYAFNIDPFSRIDTALINYKESRDLAISFSEPTGVCFHDSQLFVVGDQKLQIIEPNGKLLKEVTFIQKPTCVYTSAENIFIGFRKSLEVLNRDGVKVAEWNTFSDSTVITSIAEKSGIVFVADAGKRIVRKFNLEGKPQGEIEGNMGHDGIGQRAHHRTQPRQGLRVKCGA